MKKLLTLAVLLFATATTASAQFVSGGSNGQKNVSTSATEEWSRIFVSYNAISIEKQDLNGLSLGYAHSANIVRSLPLFIEVAPQVTYGFGTEDLYGYDLKTSYLAVNLPVNLVYNFAIGGSGFSLAPYFGLNFRGNILGQSKCEDYKLDFFSEDDMGKDGKFRYFQLGGQVGLGANYKHLYVGVGYSFDFMELAKNTKMSIVSVSVGYNF